MKGSQKIILGVVTALSLMLSAPAFADNDGRGRGRDDDRGRGHSQNVHNKHHNHDHRDVGRINYNYQRNIGRPSMVRIYDNDRVILNRYVEDRYRYDWSKNQHGHAYGFYRQPSRKYVVGYPLPHNVTYYSVPYEIRSHLRPTPIGYQYIRVDDDVLLMNSASKHIIDAVTLISALGQR